MFADTNQIENACTSYDIKILKSLTSSSLTKKEKYLLSSYCKPEQALKNQLLADSCLPASAKIRLGDKNAENELIKEFQQTNDFGRREQIVAELADAGTERCLHFLISVFNKPIYYHPRIYNGDSCIGRSIGSAVIAGFSKAFA